MFLHGIERKPNALPTDQFPWSLPLFAHLDKLEFHAPVTFLVGENGSGKSTLLEGLAVGVGAIAAGSQDLDHDETLWAAHEFARAFRFIRRRHSKRTMFMRAEDVLGYTLAAAKQRKEAAIAFGGGIKALEAARQVEEREEAADISKPSIDQAAARLKRRLARKYSSDPVNRSHGETFLEVLQERLKPDGLYFLDEPESPLSPTRVLALLLLLVERAARNCQFIISTHSPILMAVPGAEILLLEDDVIKAVPYEEVEHVVITKAFLKDPAKFLRRL
jgi:predicted ATPase